MESNDTATRDTYHIATALNELVPTACEDVSQFPVSPSKSAIQVAKVKYLARFSSSKLEQEDRANAQIAPLELLSNPVAALEVKSDTTHTHKEDSQILRTHSVSACPQG